jgi:hypothetical protein
MTTAGRFRLALAAFTIPVSLFVFEDEKSQDQ